jgi:hypothetical protein
MTNAEFQIITDGRTIWVNAPTGECVGRFSKFGIDAHTTVEEQLNGASQCLHCTHIKPDMNAWNEFVDDMKRFYHVDIEDSYLPNWLK